VRDFYRYQSIRFEPWDGPAALAFSDGVVVGVALDRNGLRPIRWQRTSDGLVAAASEAGVVTMAPEKVVERGRLGPGQMLLVDTRDGSLLRDSDAKERAASRHDYGLLADRIPRPAVFGIGLVFFAIGYVGLGLTANAVAAWLLIGVYGLFTGCTDGVGKAWISSQVGADQQGSAQGVFQGASGFAVLAAGLWAGFLWGADGRLPLLISGVVGGVCAVGLLAAAIYGRTGTATSTSSSANGGAPTPTTE